jgi:host factor-I protein
VKKKEIRPPRTSRKLQHQQLTAHSVSRAPVIVYLSNGTRMQGIVIASDDYMLLLAKHPQDDRPTMVYKSAISLIVPGNGPEAPIVVPDPASAPDFVPIYMPRPRRRR